MLNVRKCCLIAIFVIAVIPGMAHGQAHWQPGMSGDMTFETSDFMKKTAYRNPAKISNEHSQSGAYGTVNEAWEAGRSRIWYIEEQRYGADAVAAGIAQNNENAIVRGIRILDWGFRMERPDGSFACPDNFHSASFFIEAAAHSALMIENSPYRDMFKNDVNAMKPKLSAAAHWMIRPEVEKEGKKHDFPYTHRRYLDAAALGETGVLTGDETLIHKSHEFIHEGINRQAPSGFNPEKNGYDSSYHAVGLLFAERYYTIVADDNIRKEMNGMLNRAVVWLNSRIMPDGSIDPTGNTRTGLGQEVGRNGKVKTINTGAVYKVFAYGSIITGNASLEQTAWKVFNAEERNR
jgi:hypothetical protein